jgi:uncharacterized protein (TIGR04255 family)
VGRKMTSAPVYLTLAQVRFNQLLALDSYVPAIQEKFRKLGYPDVQKAVLQTFNLNVTGVADDSRAVPVVPTAQYVFSNIEKTAGFILQQNGLTFHSTDYDTFETFSATLLEGLEFVNVSVGGLSFSDRIGVRYLDAIYPREGEGLSLYLIASVLGLIGKIEGQVVYSFLETMSQVRSIKLIARTIFETGKVGFPADMHPMPFVLPERFRTLDGLHATLDTDGFTEVREVFNLNVIKVRLLEIHHEIEKVFKAIVTPRALEIWK